MKALVKTLPTPGLEFIEIKKPVPKKGEVLIKVRATALCGTDMHIIDWNPWAQNARINLPLILGHECCGEIVVIGEDVKGFEIGDHVAVETHIPCGVCLQCQIGEQDICNNLELFGVSKDGCFAEYTVVPAICARKIPKEIPFEIGAVFEPLGTSFRAASKCEVAGKNVAVIGCGPMGLFAVASALYMGAAKVIAMDVSNSRLQIAKKMGATIIINSSTEDVVQIVKKFTNGYGVDAIIECSGNTGAINQGFKYLRKGGKYALVGLPGNSIELNLGSDVIFKGVTIFGVHGRKMFSTWYALENALASGRFDISPVITHIMPLEDFEKGFDLARKGLASKVVFIP
ncbi:MAG TPA: L-threonine 3-dehydrogenase [Clostridium sp.]|uniref:L-threonine 3-dehydrogenase n=1 Tax=Clostridium sp. TaxID=1506 RepID=UPI002F927900